ncbi:MAG: hypothetical protein ABIW76_23210 [Fibrobacteria bacterium]
MPFPSNPMTGLSRFLFILPVSLFSLATLAGGEEAKPELDGFHAKMALEFGHLWSGENRGTNSSRTVSTNLDLVPLNRNIVTLTYQSQSRENWNYFAGFKGILWWPFSTEIGEPGSRTVRVEPHLSILKAQWEFGSGLEASFIEFGFIPYKYNRDARNLGEYLYRSGTYPGDIVTTDGYQFMDHAFYDAYGIHARFNTLDGLVTHDLNLFTEAVIEPIGDITPAYELGLKASRFELGAGAAYNRGIAYRPSKSRPVDEDNLYIEVKADPAKGYAYYKGPFMGAPSEVREDPSKPYAVLHRWTQRGIKLMARAAIDLGDLLPEDLGSTDDLRIYGELAVLGLENQPYYYESLLQRMPIMVGINLPTFKLLNMFSVQAEYYDGKFNNVSQSDRSSVPIWTVANYSTRDLDTYKPSKWRWSLYGKKSLNPLLNVNFQVASDHLRLRNALSTRSDYALTPNPSSWYYLLKLEMGI